MDNEWDMHTSWIWHPDYDDTQNPGSIVLFRREFHLTEVPQSLTITVTADTRYRLFVNGQSVSVGPCKGTPSHWYYETVDASGLLRPGPNVIASSVLRYSPMHRGNTPVTRSRIPGFILLAQGGKFSLPTDLDWRCVEDKSVKLCGKSNYDLFLSVNETVIGEHRHFGWTEAGFNDSAWLVPKLVTNEFPGIIFSELPWSLFPRPIPQLTEIPKRFKSVVQIRRGQERSHSNDLDGDWTQLLREARPLIIPADQEVEVDIEASEYSTGYLQFAFQDGKDAIVRHLSAESYELTPRKTALETYVKGNRRNFENGYLNGEWDEYRVAGQAHESYEPFWFRTFRFVRLHVKTATAPLIIKNVSYRETNYPLNVRANFATDSAMFQGFWDISLRTLRNCMHETYEDCPYYEQTQYSFDTRTQILLTYIVSGDDRLARKALHDLHSGARPDGLISFRSPSHTNIVVPPFSLFFPLMVYDHIMYFGESDLARRYFPTIEGILDYFDRLIGPLGLVDKVSRRIWQYCDWVEEWPHGMPIAALEGPGTYYSMLYAYSLEAAASVVKFLGHLDKAVELLNRKAGVIKAINTHCYDGTWYWDGPAISGPSTGWLSQHCQIYAVLSGAIHGPAAQDLLLRTMHEPKLAKASLSQTFYLFRALEKTGMYHLSSDMWKPWVSMASQGLDTWAEVANNPRSDCHGWSAAPLYEIASMVLGIQPASPGFACAQVRPRLRLLNCVDGSVVTPKGLLKVKWDRIVPAAPKGKERVYLSIEAPADVTVTLSVQDAVDSTVVTVHGRYEAEFELM